MNFLSADTKPAVEAKGKDIHKYVADATPDEPVGLWLWRGCLKLGPEYIPVEAPTEASVMPLSSS